MNLEGGSAREPAATSLPQPEASRPRELLGGAIVGALDQALLSAFSLLLGLAFIRLAPKADYALYVLMGAVLLLFQSLQNALVNSPLTTLWPAQADDAGRECIMRAASLVQGWMLLALLAGGAILAALAWVVEPRQVWTVLAIACGCAGLLSREFVRARHFLRQNARRALASDSVYVALSALAVAALAGAHAMGAAAVIAAVGFAGMLAGIQGGLHRGRQFGRPSDIEREGLREIWACARWALPSVVSSWLYGNAFLYVVGEMMSHEAVADISASRLLLVPLSLLVVGWSNAYRPRASRWLAAGQTATLSSAARRSALAMVGVSLLYGLVLLVLLPVLQQHVLGPKYRGLEPLVLAWLGFFTVSAVRNVGMSTLLASARSFRPLFVFGLVALATAGPGVVAACAWRAEAGVVLALSLAELLLCALIWGPGWRQLKSGGETT